MAAIAATTRRIRIGSAGVMLPHYSALKVAEQFRVLEAHRPGADRPRRGPRAGLGPADGLCAEPARQCGRRIPAAGARAAELGRGDSAAGRSSVPQHRGASAGPDQPRDLDSRQLRLRRAARRAFRPALCVRLFLQRRPGRGRGARALPAKLSPQRALSGADRDDLRLGARGRHRSRSAPAAARRANSGASASSRACAIRWCRPSRRPRIRIPKRSARAIDGAAPQGASSAPRSTWPRASRAGAAPGAGRNRRQHLDLRPGRAAPLLRAAGGGVRARACRALFLAATSAIVADCARGDRAHSGPLRRAAGYRPDLRPAPRPVSAHRAVRAAGPCRWGSSAGCRGTPRGAASCSR